MPVLKCHDAKYLVGATLVLSALDQSSMGAAV
jgi:hypothetical protein